MKKRLGLAAVLAAAALGLGLSGSPSPAFAAGSNCSVTLCGNTDVQRSGPRLATTQWCWGPGWERVRCGPYVH